MKRLAILGASGHGRVVADTAECCGWSRIDFYDDAWPDCSTNSVWPVVGNSAALLSVLSSYDGVLVAIGNNTVREAKLRELREHGAALVVLIHPAATVSRYASLGDGSVVFAGAVINAGVCVGIAAIINTGAIIDHDCVLGDAVHISPGARLAGAVVVGGLAWVGIGASVRQLIKIGQRVIVAAGAVVVSDVPDDIIVAGIPAARMR